MGYNKKLHLKSFLQYLKTKIMKQSYYFIFTILSIFFFACAEDADPPIINSLTIQNQIKIEEGASLSVNYDFSDDNGLKQYNITILDNFDVSRLQFVNWEYDADFNLTGTSANGVKSISIPYPVEPGQYELTITVQDINDNDVSESKFFELYFDMLN